MVAAPLGESFAFVDAASVRETGDAIWFDRPMTMEWRKTSHRAQRIDAQIFVEMRFDMAEYRVMHRA